MRTFKQEEELADLILTRRVKNRAPFSSSSRFKAGNEFPAIIASGFLPSIVEQEKKNGMETQTKSFVKMINGPLNSCRNLSATSLFVRWLV